MTLRLVQTLNWVNIGALQACKVLCGIMLVFLLGCVSAPSRVPSAVEVAEQPAHENFALEGRLAVKHGKDGFSATFTWAQKGPKYSIRLWGPLGQGRTLIEGSASTIEITTADGIKHSDDHPQRLMQQWLGWSVPFDVFRYWVQGRSAPQSETSGAPVEKVALVQKTDSGSFEQLDWQINPSRYRAVEGGVMPMKTIAVSEDFKITLVIRKAKLG